MLITILKSNYRNDVIAERNCEPVSEAIIKTHITYTIGNTTCKYDSPQFVVLVTW